jgi:hypothetical protein
MRGIINIKILDREKYKLCTGHKDKMRVGLGPETIQITGQHSESFKTLQEKCC